MTQDVTNDSFSVAVCPVDGTAQDVIDLQKEQTRASKERLDSWIEAIKYQANQQLAMATLSQLATQYFADQSLQASLDAADKQYDIANRQMIIAEEEYQRYKARFFCVEHALAAEACEAWEENPDYETAEARAVRNSTLAFTPQWENLRRNRSRYCMCDNQKDFCDLAAEEAKASVAARMAAYQMEDVRAKLDRESYNNFRALRVGEGRNIQSQQLNTYAQAMQPASAAIQAAADARTERYGVAAGGINSLLSAYFTPRISNPQVYNGTFGRTSGISAMTVTGNPSGFSQYNNASTMSYSRPRSESF
jgi:hypothetical protein